jgi:hypothetical protein
MDFPEDLIERMSTLEKEMITVKEMLAKLTASVLLVEKKTTELGPKITFVDRGELDKFAEDSLRLTFEEGVARMSELNWNIPIMMKKLRSFYHADRYQGCVFWYSYAAQKKYFKEAGLYKDRPVMSSPSSVRSRPMSSTDRSSRQRPPNKASYGPDRLPSFRPEITNHRHVPPFRKSTGPRRTNWFG